MGIEPKAAIAIDRNAASFDSVANELLAAKLDCTLFTANASPVAKIIDRMHQAKYPGLFYASSFAGQDLIDTLVAKRQSCVMSMVVPRPTAMGVGIVAHCQRDLALLTNGRTQVIAFVGAVIVFGVAVVVLTQRASKAKELDPALYAEKADHL